MTMGVGIVDVGERRELAEGYFGCLEEELELVSELLPAAIGCEARGSALSAKKVLDVLQYASEPSHLRPLPTSLSLDFASKSVLKPVLEGRV
jgi:hypothetical protein